MCIYILIRFFAAVNRFGKPRGQVQRDDSNIVEISSSLYADEKAARISNIKDRRDVMA